jgi:AcrR family transcriptional regulator
MRKQEPEELTPKAVRTRAHIFETALRLFSERGYQTTTMRDIAAAAGCSLGLTYRYFASKEELVIAVYEQSLDNLTAEVEGLKETSLARRFTQTVRNTLGRLAPYRESFAVICGMALNPNSSTGVLNENTTYLRQASLQLFRQVVSGAKDAPQERDLDNLTTLFYASYLLLLLFWVQDRTPEQAATEKILQFAEDTIGRLRPLLKLPAFAKAVGQLAGILTPLFG